MFNVNNCDSVSTNLFHQTANIQIHIEVPMISNTFDLNYFIEQTLEKSYPDIILMAQAEATEAERLYYREKKDIRPTIDQPLKYAVVLKEFIAFMRSDIKPFFFDGINDDHLIKLKQKSMAWRLHRGQMSHYS